LAILEEREHENLTTHSRYCRNGDKILVYLFGKAEVRFLDWSSLLNSYAALGNRAAVGFLTNALPRMNPPQNFRDCYYQAFLGASENFQFEILEFLKANGMLHPEFAERAIRQLSRRTWNAITNLGGIDEEIIIKSVDILVPFFQEALANDPRERDLLLKRLVKCLCATQSFALFEKLKKEYNLSLQYDQDSTTFFFDAIELLWDDMDPTFLRFLARELLFKGREWSLEFSRLEKMALARVFQLFCGQGDFNTIDILSSVIPPDVIFGAITPQALGSNILALFSHYTIRSRIPPRLAQMRTIIAVAKRFLLDWADRVRIRRIDWAEALESIQCKALREMLNELLPPT